MKKLIVTLAIVFAAIFTQATSIRYSVKAMQGETVLKEVSVDSRLEVDNAVTQLSVQYPQSDRIEISTEAVEPVI